MRVIVTGARGFVGSNLCRELGRLGHEVIRVVRPTNNRQNENLANVLEMDLCHAGAFEEAIEKKPQCVIHLAAVLPESFEGDHAQKAAEENRVIDQNVLLSCKNARVGVVYTSTSSVYGHDTGEEKKESSRLSPIGPYASGKLNSERIGQELLEASRLQFTVLRINAPYGPCQRAATVLNVFLDRALRGQPLYFHGSGSRQQDFTYVDDVSEAIIKAVMLGKSGIYNISGGCAISMRKLAELIIRGVPGCRSWYGPSGQDDPQEGATALFSIEKAAEELGWHPKMSLESGLAACVKARLG